MNRYFNENILRISKTKARRLYKQRTVYVLPTNINFHNQWLYPTIVPQDCEDFDRFVNDYEIYNCNYETGRYCSFYIDSYIKRE